MLFFSWADACILIMTFVQSFIVLGVFHGIFHKSDLSLDAVIKLFGAGFIIATPMAFLVEVIILNILIAIYYFIALIVSLFADEGIGVWIYDNCKYFLTVADIVQAFVVAAAVEEICKYYTFRSVEHPDLIFLTGLDRTKQDVSAKIGGGEAYPFSSNNTSSLDHRTSTFESKFSFRSKSFRMNHHGMSPSILEKVRSGQIRKRNRDEEINYYELNIRTIRQQAAAVTTAMISTAVGLACAENFIYVFFFSGSYTHEELIMVAFQSVFPVHALCTGIQSIGMVKKFLEEGPENEEVGVGRSVFPAIMLHGSFDSVLILINSYIDIVSEKGDLAFLPFYQKHAVVTAIISSDGDVIGDDRSGINLLHKSFNAHIELDHVLTTQKKSFEQELETMTKNTVVMQSALDAMVKAVRNSQGLVAIPEEYMPDEKLHKLQHLETVCHGQSEKIEVQTNTIQEMKQNLQMLTQKMQHLEEDKCSNDTVKQQQHDIHELKKELYVTRRHDSQAIHQPTILMRHTKTSDNGDHKVHPQPYAKPDFLLPRSNGHVSVNQHSIIPYGSRVSVRALGQTIEC